MNSKTITRAGVIMLTLLLTAGAFMWFFSLCRLALEQDNYAYAYFLFVPFAFLYMAIISLKNLWK